MGSSQKPTPGIFTSFVGSDGISNGDQKFHTSSIKVNGNFLAIPSSHRASRDTTPFSTSASATPPSLTTTSRNGFMKNLGTFGAGEAERQDTLSIKQELANALGSSGPTYWKAFGQFLIGKLILREFDEIVEEILQKDSVRLHNKLVLAILSNVHRNTKPPQGPPHVEFKPSPDAVVKSNKRKAEQELSLQDKKRLYRLGQIQTLDVNTRKHMHSVKEQPPESKPYTPSFIPSVVPKEVTPELQSQILTLQTCKMRGSLPTRDGLRSRMEIIGAMNGVTIDDECITFMEQALSTHLKDIISSIQVQVRPIVEEPSPNIPPTSKSQMPSAAPTPKPSSAMG
ncbi:hypothetical protein HDU76_007807 [Blyttiomyces sp. JEL0837]|nr:hypothetical protein HDU76_007807 [Blyttiomyces sp. JEL0837]